MKKIYKKLRICKAICCLLSILLIIYNLYFIYINTNINKNGEYDVYKTAFSTDYENEVEKNLKNDNKIENILEEVTKSVVGISKLSSVGGSILNNISSESLGLGTGIIVSEKGYILSNNHVTGDKYSSCYVTIDQNTYTGTVVWSEPELDLSIIKIQANNLNCINLGDSKEIRVGESVYAIGNPIGYEFRGTVTSGIISALNRTIRIEENSTELYISDLIQTDAVINPGNSGGPLINSKGEVIGINTVKITSAEAIGFAIPINVIKPVIESFKKNNSFDEATLGLLVYDSQVAEYLKVKNNIYEGIYVSKIILNGPSYESGLEEGDIITNIDGNRLNTINDLRQNIYRKKPGDEVVLKVIRKQRELEIPVTLENKN